MTLFKIILILHIGIGTIGIFAFWVPIFSRKGGAKHKRFGKIYARSAYLVMLLAAVLVFLRFAEYWAAGERPFTEPHRYAFSLFLLYLAFITFLNVTYATGVLKYKTNPQALNTPARRALAISSIIFSLALISYATVAKPNSQILLYALSPIGILGGFSQLKYFKTLNASKHTWLYEHLGSMIGGGIAYHTAFLVFGANRYLSEHIPSSLAILPWVLPTLIGIPAAMLWKRRYQKKYGEI